MSAVDTNVYDVLSSPVESKERESRSHKDDRKEQLHQAREGIKNKAVELREQVVSGLSQGVEMVKEKAGLAGKPNAEIVEEVQDRAAGEWETVKRKGRKIERQVEDQLDENLTPQQKAQLKRGLKDAKQGAQRVERQARGWSNSLINSTLAGPTLRPVRNFIQRNNLQLPVVILGAFLTLWLSLSLIRMLTHIAAPAQPEFDIHSKENTMAWARFHAGEYKDKAVDMRDSLAGRAAAFLANHKLENLKDRAVDYREIGMKRLGLAEPTWGEWAWARLTGRPITWQERVENVINLARDGINRPDLKAASAGIMDKVKGVFQKHEPTLQERAADALHDIRQRIPGQAEPTLMDRVHEGIDSIRAHLPGQGDAAAKLEQAKQAAYDATHQSTLDHIKSGATYIKNRVVHGAQEAAHIAQDRANELADKAQYKAGL